MDFILSLDHQLFKLINSTLAHPALDLVMPAITDLHKRPLFAVLIVLLLIGALVFKFKKRALVPFLGLILCLGTSDMFGNHMIKKNVKRLRPGDQIEVNAIVRSSYAGTSFISNHATNTFAAATYLRFLFPAGAIFFYGIAALIAFSRVYVGVHFPLDVFCGALIGVFWGWVYSKILYSHYLQKYWNPKMLGSV